MVSITRSVLVMGFAVALAGCLREVPADGMGLVAGADARISAPVAVKAAPQLSPSRVRGQAPRKCVVVADSATTVGEVRTRRIAEAGLHSTLEKRRGELIAEGMRRLVISPASTKCTPYLTLGVGMQEFICKSSAEICGIADRGA